LGRDGAEIFAVVPLELGEVEDGAAEADIFEDEVLDHLGEGELFRAAIQIRRYAPAHEAEEVDEGFGKEAALAIVDERDGIFALGYLGLVDVPQQRHVPEAGKRPAEGLVEQDV